MKIYVCVKHVPDSAATIKIRDKNQIEENITFLLNPYDEHAVTEAARLKKELPGVEVIAVCLAKSAAENTLRSAMAMGADRSILITTDRYHDSMVTARVLKAAIEGDGRPSLILGGKESIDAEGMQTLFRLARLFSMPAATNVVKITVEDAHAVVECEKEAGAREVMKLGLPCALGAGRGLNTPRYPTLPDIMKARKKEIRRIPLDALALGKPAGAMEILELVPSVESREPKALAGDPEAVVDQLIRILKDEAKVI
jgi:electron transfer flavoprotein beta subunit